jgi:formylglycine-generating enzyme required for sulfatase activity
MTKRYNLINIRTLLKEGFSDEELRDFCFDVPDFKPVYDQLAHTTGKAELVRKLLEYAHQKLKLELLLTWAEKTNPAQFSTHQPYFKDDSPASDAEAPVSYVSALYSPSSSRPPSASLPSTYQPSKLPTLQPSAPSLRIFLCHASGDKPAVRELYHRLRADGFEPWLDEEALLPGQDWQREIPKAVRAADIVIICLSHIAINKAGYVQKEIRFALDVADEQPDGTIFLIPLKLEECEMPERLQRWQWVNFFDERGYGRLQRALQMRVQEKAKAEAETKADPQPPTPDPLPKILPRRFDFEPEMIFIPAGKFLMGSDPKKDEYADESEQHQHSLYLPDFYMAKTPVTNAQYAAFVQAANYRLPNDWQNKQPSQDKGNYPVVHVSWVDVVAYCHWLAETTGKSYRLPSEAEWEKGARGADGRIYPWGNQWDAKCCNSVKSGKLDTTPVDAYPTGASLYGLLDMAGNVWEWCSTIWQEKAYPFQVNDEWAQDYLAKIERRTLRGGAFVDDAQSIRCAVRANLSPNFRDNDLGFRVAMSPF